MQPTRKLLSMAATLLATAVFSGAAAAGQAGLSCKDWSMGGTAPMGGPNIVYAKCRSISGAYQANTLWLPAVLGNSNGRVVPSINGYYDRSCRNLSYVKQQYAGDPNHWIVQYSGLCQASTGAWFATTFDLADLLNNNNGNLGI